MQVLVKCRNCQNLKVYHHPNGLVCRCGVGFYDKVGQPYFSVLALKSGNIGMFKAIELCLANYKKVVKMEEILK